MCGVFVPTAGGGMHEQGRESEQLFPYGIYTIPEVSMIGKTEAQLTAEGVSYEVRIFLVVRNVRYVARRCFLLFPPTPIFLRGSQPTPSRIQGLWQGSHKCWLSPIHCMYGA